MSECDCLVRCVRGIGGAILCLGAGYLGFVLVGLAVEHWYPILTAILAPPLLLMMAAMAAIGADWSRLPAHSWQGEALVWCYVVVFYLAAGGLWRRGSTATERRQQQLRHQAARPATEESA